MSCDEPPPPQLLEGIAQFNRGEFFEQHETLEEAWIEEEDPIRYLYQGILQIGVGFYHLLAKSNAYGAGRMWAKGVQLLESFPPACAGVDVADLVAATRRCMDELERRGIQDFDRSLIPQVRLIGPPSSS
jgi:predicted metal-dependent hydrolase